MIEMAPPVPSPPADPTVPEAPSHRWEVAF